MGMKINRGMKFKIKAFTLIELLVVMVIVGILATGFSAFYVKFVDIWKFVSFRTDIVNEARIGLIRIIRDLRQLTLLEQIGSQTIRFLAMDENDNLVRIRYRWVGDDVFYDLDNLPTGNPDGVFDSSNILMNGVAAFQFTYYDIAGAVTTTMSEVYMIDISITLQEGTEQFTLNARVFPRNFK